MVHNPGRDPRIIFMSTPIVYNKTRPKQDTSQQSLVSPAGDSHADNTMQGMSKALLKNGVYEGTVTACDMSARTLNVKVHNVTVKNCAYMPLMFASFLGTTINAFPPTGARVLVMYASGNAYVIGSKSVTEEKLGVFKGRVCGDPSKEECAASNKAFNKKRSKGKTPVNNVPFPQGDMYPGEAEISDNMGTAVRVLYGLAQLTSGDLAKVEACLYNAMVRIVDSYFVHHSCGGDHLIWSNGGCNEESHFTSHQFEADGKKEESGTLTSKGEHDAYKTKDQVKDRYGETGRWRKSTYIGFLGDMIHTFVTQPTDVISNTMEGAVRSGLFRSWVGSDGTLMIQAAGGVHVEVTPKIVVPTMLKAWNDPELDHEKLMEDLDDKYIKLWGNGPDWKDLRVSCWQMGAYLRYITLWHSLARFRQMENGKLCKVPKVTEAKAAEVTAKEQDREKANPNGKHPYLAESSFSIDPAGSITMQSNGLASVVLDNGNVQIAAVGNIELKAGNTVVIEGKYNVFHSLLDTEIVSLAGKITQRAVKAFKILCDKGRLWLKSCAPKVRDGEQPPADSDEVPDDKNKRELNKYAIVLDASEGDIMTVSGGDIDLVAGDGAASGDYGCIGLDGDRLKASFNDVALRMDSMSIAGTSCISKFSTHLDYSDIVAGNTFALGNGLALFNNVVEAKGVSVTGSFISASSTNVSKNKDFKDDFKEHVEDHISSYTEDEEIKGLIDEADSRFSKASSEDRKWVEWKGVDSVKKEFTDPKEGAEWEFREWELPSDVEKWSSLKRPFLRYKDIKQQEYKSMMYGSDSMRRVNQSILPWPGQSAQQWSAEQVLEKYKLGKVDVDFDADPSSFGTGAMKPGDYKMYFAGKDDADKDYLKMIQDDNKSK